MVFNIHARLGWMYQQQIVMNKKRNPFLVTMVTKIKQMSTQSYSTLTHGNTFP